MQHVPVLEKGVLEGMLRSSPVLDNIDGRFELAIRGCTVEIDGQRFEVSPDQPLQAGLLNKLVGFAMSLAGARQGGGVLPDFSISLDFLLAVDVGPGFTELEDWLRNGLQDSGAHFKRSTSEVAGHQVEKLSVAFVPELPVVNSHLYLAKQKGTWLISGNEKTLASALTGSSPSLADSKSFRNLTDLTSSERPALMAYFNVHQLCSMFHRLVPPIVLEELDVFGLTSVDALGFASSFVEGGVRDSLALSFRNPPKGILGLLNSSQQGMQFLARAPAETGIYLGLSCSPQEMLAESETLLDSLIPGSGRSLQAVFNEIHQQFGLDLRKDLLPAFGREVGLYVTAPGEGGFLPEAMLMVEVDRRESFQTLIDHGLMAASQHGMPVSEVNALPEGCQGWVVKIPDSPVQPAIALTDQMLVVAMNALALKTQLREMSKGMPATNVTNNPAFASVAKGLTGQLSVESLDFLAFVDLHQAVTVGYQFLPMAASSIEAELDGALDLSQMPQAEVVAKHFSGIGIGGACTDQGLSLNVFSPFGLTGVFGGMAVSITEASSGELVVSDAHVRTEAPPRRAEPAVVAVQVAEHERGFMGVSLEPSATGGVPVTAVIEGTPAMEVGLQAGDVLQSINGQDVENSDKLFEVLSSCRPGQSIELQVQREGAALVMQMTLARRSDFVAPELTAVESVQPPQEPPPPAPTRTARARLRRLPQLFDGLELATGVTILYPEKLDAVEVHYAPRSGDLETILSELSVLAGFHYEIEEVGGARLVRIREK
jgi:hypothetical protein